MKKATVPISVIILTHRRDGRWKQAVASAQWAKEILIADYSKKKPIVNFSVERNKLLKRAKNDWVFFVDSDEVIEAKSWPHIETLIRNSQLDGVYVRRQDVFHGRLLRFGETGTVWLLRLMRKRAAHFSRPVHEVAQVKGATRRSRITLKHFTHTSITEFLQDITRYAQIEAEYQTDSQLPIFLLALKTVIYPKGKFVANYFFRLGFLDGWQGLTYAVMMSLHSVFVRVFSYEDR